VLTAGADLRVDGRPEGVRMNLNLTGNHLEITPAIRDYVVAKLDRLTRHFDHVIDVNVVLSVNKLRQKIEANLHIRGKDLHAESIEPDMYAAIDALVDKLDRMVLKAKEKRVADRHDSAEIKRDPAVWSPESEPPAASAGTPRV
jgi:putative sigma-54 modulation protein